MLVQSCESCRFSVQSIPNEGDGFTPIRKCHRYPATLIWYDGDIVQARPDADEWCGEWEAIPDPPAVA